MSRILVGLPLILCWMYFASGTYAQVRALNPEVINTETPARLVALTAHISSTNETNSPILRYVFRVTKPAGDVASQRVLLLGSDIPPALSKTHKTGANEYLEFHFPMAPNSTVKNDVKFLVLVVPVDFTQVKRLRKPPQPAASALEPYLQPTPFIESDSAEVNSAAKEVFAQSRSLAEKAFSAYRYPSKALKFQLQKERLGAQKALQSGAGDCTEHACLFAALCRTQQIPARRMAVFNMGSNEEIDMKQPNHDIAEVFLASHGWIPVDANLGRGRTDRPIGFGKLSNTFIIMNREGAFVWSTWLPPNGFNKALSKPKTKHEISWTAKVLKQGNAKRLFREFAARQR